VKAAEGDVQQHLNAKTELEAQLAEGATMAAGAREVEVELTTLVKAAEGDVQQHLNAKTELEAQLAEATAELTSVKMAEAEMRVRLQAAQQEIDRLEREVEDSRQGATMAAGAREVELTTLVKAAEGDVQQHLNAKTELEAQLAEATAELTSVKMAEAEMRVRLQAAQQEIDRLEREVEDSRQGATMAAGAREVELTTLVKAAEGDVQQHLNAKTELEAQLAEATAELTSVKMAEAEMRVRLQAAQQEIDRLEREVEDSRQGATMAAGAREVELTTLVKAAEGDVQQHLNAKTELEAQLAEATAELTSVKMAEAEMRVRLQAAQQEIDRLEREVEDSRQGATMAAGAREVELTALVKAAEGDVQQHLNAKTELEAQLAEATAELTSVKMAEAEMRVRLQAAQQEIDRLEREVEDSRQGATMAAGAREVELTTLVKAAEGDVQQHLNAKAELEARLAVCSDEKAAVEVSLKDARRLLAEQLDLYAKAESQWATELQSLQTRDASGPALAEVEESLKRTKVELEATKQVMHRKAKETAELQSRLRALGNDSAISHAETLKLEFSLLLATELASSWSQQLDSAVQFLNSIARAEHTRAERLQESSRAEQQLAAVTSQLTKRTAAVVELQSNLAESQNALLAAAAEAQRHVQVRAELEMQLKTLHNTAKSTADETEQLRGKVNVQTAHIKDLRRRLDLETEEDDVSSPESQTTRFRRAELDAALFKKQLEVAQEQSAKLRKRTDVAEKRVSELEAELRAAADGHATTMVNLNADLETSKKLLQSMKTRVMNAEANSTEQQKQAAQLKTELEHANAEVQSLKSSALKQQAAIARLENAAKRRNSLATSEPQDADAQEDNETQGTDPDTFAHLQQQLVDVRHRSTSFRKKADNLAAELAEERRETDHLRRTLERYRAVAKRSTVNSSVSPVAPSAEESENALQDALERVIQERDQLLQRVKTFEEAGLACDVPLASDEEWSKLLAGKDAVIAALEREMVELRDHQSEADPKPKPKPKRKVTKLKQSVHADPDDELGHAALAVENEHAHERIRELETCLTVTTAKLDALQARVTGRTCLKEHAYASIATVLEDLSIVLATLEEEIDNLLDVKREADASGREKPSRATVAAQTDTIAPEVPSAAHPYDMQMFTQLQSKVDELLVQREEWKSKHDRLVKDHNTLTKSCEDVNKKLSACETELKVRLKEVDQLHDDEAKLKEQLERARSRHKDEDTSKCTFGETLEDLKDARRQLSASEANVTSLQAQITERDAQSMQNMKLMAEQAKRIRVLETGGGSRAATPTPSDQDSIALKLRLAEYEAALDRLGVALPLQPEFEAPAKLRLRELKTIDRGTIRR
jgi:chromosome segregation ATPase